MYMEKVSSAEHFRRYLEKSGSLLLESVLENSPYNVRWILGMGPMEGD